MKQQSAKAKLDNLKSCLRFKSNSALTFVSKTKAVKYNPRFNFNSVLKTAGRTRSIITAGINSKSSFKTPAFTLAEILI